jgi:hypothetical protein
LPRPKTPGPLPRQRIDQFILAVKFHSPPPFYLINGTSSHAANRARRFFTAASERLCYSTRTGL